MKKFKLTVLLLSLTIGVFAQAKDAVAPIVPVAAPQSMGLSSSELLIIALLIFSAVLLAVTITLFNAFKVMYKVQADPNPYQPYQAESPIEFEDWLKQKKSKPNFWTKILSLKPLEEEKGMIIPHSYDGIQELNNPVPAWFNILFFGTIIFAAGYLFYYHVGEYGQRQDTEYETEIAKAASDKRKFLAMSGTSIDESSVKIDASQIVAGKGVFDANCIACHGDKGQGLVGPNLTDEFWLHGGSINDIFKTVKYGVPEKGMVSWEKNLSAANISEVSNYIISLKDTKPAGPKEPQGVKYEDKSVQDTVKNENSKSK